MGDWGTSILLKCIDNDNVIFFNIAKSYFFSRGKSLKKMLKYYC